MARFCPLFSSSRGNSTYVGSSDGGILIDCGVSAKKLHASLDSVGVNPDSIGAIFITHEHTDHICGLKTFASAHGIDVYASLGTVNALTASGALNGKFPVNIIDDNGVEVNGIFVRPFHLSHDAREPFGYSAVTSDNRRICVATDTGTVTDEILSAIYGSDLVLLESNHDIGMLQNGSYPYMTKRRILSDLGHLSNDLCAETAVKLLEGGTTRFCLAHLSKENNIPSLAYQSTYSELTQIGAVEGRDYRLSVAGGDAQMMFL
ncbi:MAG: MBL fold metallo-hydrolase [Clostridia bacterium]|nr:MBL fold metallo-hydrolase [Clostridia bacterium]